MNLTPEQIALLRKVQEKIRTEPEAYDQATYGRIDGCGTACCIAGWACILSGKYSVRASAWSSVAVFYGTALGEHTYASAGAGKLLGLNAAEADILFASDAGRWPEPFGSEWAVTDRRVWGSGVPDRSAYADIAVRYIDYIIENGRVD
jgi:hypothetical protein